ncbi:hypothetical protein ACOMHN_029368 [Nucella lapillus]
MMLLNEQGEHLWNNPGQLPEEGNSLCRGRCQRSAALAILEADLVGKPERWKYMREKGLETSPPVLTPQIHPRNVALSSLKRRKEAEEENQDRETSLAQKETPVAWKKAKTHKYKRKQQSIKGGRAVLTQKGVSLGLKEFQRLLKIQKILAQDYNQQMSSLFILQETVTDPWPQRGRKKRRTDTEPHMVKRRGRKKKMIWL